MTDRAYAASADIGGPPDAVWAALVDGSSWASWDSSVDAVEGRFGPGATVTIRSKVAPGRAFPVTVTVFDPPRAMVFSGGLPLGLFRGVRTYRLAPSGAGTKFEMREEYSGPLAALMFRSIPDLGPSFTQFVNGLKTLVERTAAN